MVIEGHFQGARGKHYSSREWESLRPVYASAYPHLDVEGSNPELEKKLISWEQEKRALQEQLEEKDRELKNLKNETVSKETFAAFQTKVFRELGIHVGKEIGQRTSEKKTPAKKGETKKE